MDSGAEGEQAAGSRQFSLLRATSVLVLASAAFIAMPYLYELGSETMYFSAPGNLRLLLASVDASLLGTESGLPLDAELSANAALVITLVNALVLWLFVSASWALLAKPIRSA